MACPECGHSLAHTRYASTGETRYYCPDCGWGRDRLNRFGLDDPPRGDGWGDVPIATGIHLLGYWFVSILFIVAPYAVARLAFPGYVSPSALAAFLRWYFPGVGVYLAICFLAQFNFVGARRPKWGYPATHGGDEAMGSLVQLALLLFPGMIVIYTLVSTIRALLPSPK